MLWQGLFIYLQYVNKASRSKSKQQSFKKPVAFYLNNIQHILYFLKEFLNFYIHIAALCSLYESANFIGRKYICGE